jgi:hypothetical protein
MKQLKLKANNGSSGSVKVSIASNGKIAMDRKGFVPVSSHPMWMSTIRYEYIEKYYIVPDGLSPE